MDGDSAPGSGATPGPGTGSTTGPAPATPAEVKAVEDELLGIVVDGPAAGGLGRQATTPLTAPTGGPTLGEDLAAFDQLVALADDTGTPGAPGSGPVSPGGSWIARLRRGESVGPRELVVAGGVSALFGVAILVFLLSRSSGGGTPSAGAGDPAAPARQGDVAPPAVDDAQQGDVAPPAVDDAQQGDVAPPAVDDAQQGAVGDGGGAQPGGEQGSTIEACAASAEDVKLEIADEEREELRAQMGGGPVQGYQRWVRWKQVYRSATEDPVVVIEHYTRDAGGDVEPESGWDTGSVQAPTPGDVVQRDAFRGFKVSMYGDVDPAWDYVDRVAIMRDGPECVPLWKDEAVLGRIAREVPVPAAPEPD